MNLRRLAVAGGVTAAGAAVYQRLGEANDLRRFPAPGRFIDIGGRRIHLVARGEGSPAVIIETGTRALATSWRDVVGRVAEFTTVVAYDRAGYGWSDGGRWPRTGARIAAELRAALTAAGISGPYVLVGHSSGGLYARTFASRYPDDVAGLVLVDASHENTCERPTVAELRTVLSMTTASRGVSRAKRMLAGRNDIEGALRLRSSFRWALLGESLALHRTARELAAAKPPPPVPTAVVSAGLADDSWLDLQRDLAAQSVNSVHVIADGSGHFVHQDRPVIVVDAIRQVVDAARGPSVSRSATAGGAPGGTSAREEPSPLTERA